MPVVVPPSGSGSGAATGTPDCPVLDNGLVRVRYDASVGNPGFSVDAWNGSAYVEQGKMIVQRIGDATGYLDTWLSAGIANIDNGGWTPERGMILAVLANSADQYSRESIYLTVKRGLPVVTFEVYPALMSTTQQADVQLLWTPAGHASSDSLMFEPSISQPPATATDLIWSTASSNWISAAGTFGSATSNYVSLLRCIGGATTVGPFQTTLSVLQQGATFAGVNDNHAYGGSAQPAVALATSGGTGYLQAQLAFTPTQSDQVQGASSTWTAAQSSQYRVFGLVSGAWVDEGEYTGTAVSTTGATRVEAYLTADQNRTGAQYNGSRDWGQRALTDSRMLGRLTARG